MPMPTIQSNGITLAYDIQGAGHPLLLISGIGYGGWYWRKLAPDLAAHFQVITFDNRGAGGSDKPDGPYTTAMMAADTIGLLDGLGITRTHVLGHSLGGYIAQEVALARPDLVSKLILAATTTGGPNVIPITPEALKVIADRSGDPVELFRRGVAVSTGPGFAERHPDVVEALWAYRASNPVPAAQYAAQVIAGAQHNAEARLGNIRCPTLILFGAEDKVVPPSNAELLAQKVTGAQVKILPGLGHHMAIEDPKTIVAIIVDFCHAVSVTYKADR